MSESLVSGLVLAALPAESMHSSRPKPLHMLCGKPMGSYVLDALSDVGVSQAVVVGPEANRVGKRLMEQPPGFSPRFVEQAVATGSGESVMLALSDLDELGPDENVIVLSADLPLLTPETLRALLDRHQSEKAALTALSSKFMLDEVPEGVLVNSDLVVRDKRDRVEAFVHTSSILAEDSVELAFGVYCIRRELLSAAIRRAEPFEGQVELRDIVEVLSSSGHKCVTAEVDSLAEVIPVDDRIQLAAVESELRRRTNLGWLSIGVTMVDPDNTYIDSTVTFGEDVTLFPGVILQGKTVVGDGCELGPNLRVDSSVIGQNTKIESSVVSKANIGADCRVGPYAFFPPGSELDSGTVTGPFYNGG